MRMILLGLLPVLIFLAGCTTPSEQYWSRRVGVYTYSQAVAELGNPVKESSLPGGNRIAEWLVKPGTPSQVTVTPPTTLQRPGTMGTTIPGNPGTAYTPSQPDQYLRLTFDPKGKLIAWAQESEFRKE